MKRFLYLSPYFPPQSKVGALRPLKFSRYLREFGWEPVVLADLSAKNETSDGLFDAIPSGLQVIRDYSHRARRQEKRYLEGRTQSRASRTQARKPTSRRGPKLVVPPALVPDPEWLPLGEHSIDMPWALSAARRIIRRGDVEAIMVNADPYATMLVGDRLGKEFQLPVIQDLRDPWSVCELRRPRRPALQRRVVDRLERVCVEGSSRFILNTQAALADYRSHYADVPPERFDFIRNHADADLVSEGSYEPSEVFTMLFLGNFRRFVEGDALIAALGLLRAKGYGPDRIRLMVTGRFPDDARALAANNGVEDQIVDHPFVPYREIGSFMRSADLLVSLSHPGRQRIPAKIYDYVTSDRPMLVVCDNPELELLMSEIGGVSVHRRNDIEGIARSMQRAVDAGAQRTVARGDTRLDSRTATRKLAGILDAVTR